MNLFDYRIVVCSEFTLKMFKLSEISNQRGHFMIISIYGIVHTYTYHVHI